MNCSYDLRQDKGVPDVIKPGRIHILLSRPFNRIEDNRLEAFVDSKPIQFNDLDYTIDGLSV